MGATEKKSGKRLEEREPPPLSRGGRKVMEIMDRLKPESRVTVIEMLCQTYCLQHGEELDDEGECPVAGCIDEDDEDEDLDAPDEPDDEAGGGDDDPDEEDDEDDATEDEP